MYYFTWQSPVSSVSFGPLAALTLCAETEPGDLFWGDRSLLQHLAVGLHSPGRRLRHVVSARVKHASGAVHGRVGRCRRRLEGGLPGVWGDGLRHRRDDGEGNRHQQEVKRKGDHSLQRDVSRFKTRVRTFLKDHAADFTLFNHFTFLLIIFPSTTRF